MVFQYSPPNDPIEILYQDTSLLIVNKPAGLLSVPGKAAEHADCLESRVKVLIPSALLVHRLDMDTSGVMVFATSKDAQRHLGLQFEKRYIRKRYVALVHGEMSGGGHIDLPLIVDWPNRPLQKICHDTGKAAQTDWSVVSYEIEQTRVNLFPLTGRSHQLRVHMKALGHPIVGDRFYGVDDGASRMMLHAEELSMCHPNGGREMTFSVAANF